MAISERSQRILDLRTAYNAAETRQDKAARSEELKEALMKLIDVQLPLAVKQSNFSATLLRTELLESLDGDVLQLCSEMSEGKSPRDVVNECLAEVVTVLEDSQANERDTENSRLMELLRAYRTSGQAKRETDELYKALEAKMQSIAGHLVRHYNLLPEYADEAISLVLEKWLSRGGLLHGWREDGGAAISTWVYKALNYVILDLRRKVTAIDKRLAHGNPLGGNNEGKAETDVIGKVRSGKRTESSVIRLSQLQARIQALIQEIPGKRVVLDNRNVTLTENHAKLFQLCCYYLELTDAEQAERLGVPYGTVKRWLRELYAYVRSHPDRDELLELLEPCSRNSGAPTIVKINADEVAKSWEWNEEEARVEGSA